MRHFERDAEVDLNVELELMCTDEKDIEELTKMYGPCAGRCTTRIQAASKKKTMWSGILKRI